MKRKFTLIDAMIFFAAAIIAGYIIGGVMYNMGIIK
jgi:hypothetical protein